VAGVVSLSQIVALDTADLIEKIGMLSRCHALALDPDEAAANFTTAPGIPLQSVHGISLASRASVSV